jgi:hypothetical protein
LPGLSAQAAVETRSLKFTATKQSEGASARKPEKPAQNEYTQEVAPEHAFIISKPLPMHATAQCTQLKDVMLGHIGREPGSFVII